MARKIKGGRVTYRSHNDFGPLKSFGILPKIADFGLAQRITPSRRNIHPIQPDHYRAPEVVLGIGWSYSADIWNLGVLVGVFSSVVSVEDFLIVLSLALESVRE